MLGKERFEGVDIRVRVKGGGHVSQVYGKKILLCKLGHAASTARAIFFKKVGRDEPTCAVGKNLTIFR